MIRKNVRTSSQEMQFSFLNIFDPQLVESVGVETADMED